MTVTLFLVLATSLWTIGIFMASREGSLLGKIGVASDKLLGHWNRPVLGCVFCMTSFHGFIICILFNLYFGFYTAWYWYALQWLFVAASASALNYILYNLIRILIGYASLFDEESECSGVTQINYKYVNHNEK